MPSITATFTCYATEHGRRRRQHTFAVQPVCIYVLRITSVSIGADNLLCWPLLTATGPDYHSLSLRNMASQPPPKGGMMSLYANLLDPSSDNSPAPGTISRAPVVFKQAGENDAQQDDAASKKQQISAGSQFTLPRPCIFAVPDLICSLVRPVCLAP